MNKKLREILPGVKTLDVKSLAKRHKTSEGRIKSQLKMGQEVEGEHTKNKKLASEIARDHLKELPDYYTRLKKMEENSEIPFKKRSPDEAKEAFQRLLMDRWKNRLVGYGDYGRRFNSPVPKNILPRPSPELDKIDSYSYNYPRDPKHPLNNGGNLPVLGVPTETVHSNQRSIGPKQLKAKITGEFEKKYGAEYPLGAADMIYDPTTGGHIVRDGNHRASAALIRGDAYVPGRIWIADHATKTLKPLMHPIEGVHVEWPPKD